MQSCGSFREVATRVPSLGKSWCFGKVVYRGFNDDQEDIIKQ